MKKDYVCQEDFDHKMWGALPIIVQVMYCVGCHIDKSAHLFVDLTATKAILNGIQADIILHAIHFQLKGCMSFKIAGGFVTEDVHAPLQRCRHLSGRAYFNPKSMNSSGKSR